MQFTVLSHAGLLVEHAGVRVVCDPWLLGSCYWRSWWNFPEPDVELIRDLRPDFIYLTHLHWDHFHGPSLRKLFTRSTPILVPKVPTRRMVEDLNYLGFTQVIEVPHGGTASLGADFSLRSYQFGLGVDSGVVLSGGGVTLFNCNDAKFFGLPLRQIMHDFPRIDFIFRSHSSAAPIPLCVADYERLLPDAVARSDSAEQFVRCALYVGARYAVPFASNHCFLHKETVSFNDTVTTPEDVRRQYENVAARSGRSSECVVMPPGSHWSEREGFALRSFDFSARREYIDSLLAKNAAMLAACYREEDATSADFESFERYFTALLHALPRPLRRVLPPLVFRTRDARGEHRWLVDSRATVVTELKSQPPGYPTFEVHAAVLRDCTRNRMFSVWSASKRLTIRLPSASALGGVQRWFTILDLYELGFLPLRRNFSARSLAVRARRWREALELGRIVLQRVLLRRQLSIAALYPVKVA